MKRQKNGIWKLTDGEMNGFICMMFPAAERYAQMGCPALSKEAVRMRDEIFEMLDNVGYYDKVKESEDE